MFFSETCLKTAIFVILLNAACLAEMTTLNHAREANETTDRGIELYRKLICIAYQRISDLEEVELFKIVIGKWLKLKFYTSFV